MPVGHLIRADMPEASIDNASAVALPAVPSRRIDLPRPDVDAAVEVAALLGDRTRAGILKLLATGPCCVCEIADVLDERPNNVSNHLARLRAAGLVRRTHHQADARWVYYELDCTACAAAFGTLHALLEGS